MPISRRRSLKLALTGLAALPLLAVSSGRARAATHNVQIQGFAFSPAALSVAAGDTVVFTNGDGAPHTATAADGAFDTGRINPGASAQITVSAAGSFAYRCRFHPNMTGTINAA
ncbi:MAG: cupredoxin family copper-binding protein [Rhodobacter sp.]|nr:cupredoxin family copper-binding protein [Rhodobacter sp.]